MASPTRERPEPAYVEPQEMEDRASIDTQDRSLPSYNVNRQPSKDVHDKSSDGEGTAVDDTEPTFPAEREGVPMPAQAERPSNLYALNTTLDPEFDIQTIRSPSATRERANRLGDDLEMLKVERQISKKYEDEKLRKSVSAGDENLSRTKSRRRDESFDEFDEATNPVYEQTHMFRPPDKPRTWISKLLKWIHGSGIFIRWFFYVVPVGLILLIPLMLAVYVFTRPKRTVGGVFLPWFTIWLEIVWLSLWAGRLIAKCLPWPIGLFASLFTNNDKKWRDMSKQLELPATLFFWWLAIEISFLPTMKNHSRDNGKTREWMTTTNKVLISIFVLTILNFVEKIIIQLIAISFHLRTYADRIEINKFEIGSLTKLYKFSKEKIAMDDSEFDVPSAEASGARTPAQLVNGAAKTTKAAFNKLGDMAGRVAGDFTGKQHIKSSHPDQVILALLNTTSGSQVLARRLYRTFAREETESVFSDDLKAAFDNDEEADAAFSMFDRDMNGDISMEELEAVCVEIGRERKSITASLKDLDSVVAKLDQVLTFVVLVISLLVFLSLISTSAAGVLTSAGSAVLGLAWILQATAQEFLQSLIFVFVKHPFDVGDRVSVYGNTGATGQGDDYFVKKISLLYTEFKKMEGQVVQAPNSYLNTLFILNQRRSGGLAEAVPITIKFGTTLDQIDGLRSKLLEFVMTEKREYQGKILTELRDVVEVHSMNLNVIFFYKNNWQNEGLRLARRNKFICAMMVSMQELGFEGPRMRYPGQKQSFPMYLQNVPHVNVPGSGHSGNPDQPGGMVGTEDDGQDPPFVKPSTGREHHLGRHPKGGSILRGSRMRGESLSAMDRRVDFSLGVQSQASGDTAGDVYDNPSRLRVPIGLREASRSREREVEALRKSLEKHARASQEVARTSSRDDRFAHGGLHRASTDTSRWRTGSIHRNRFFGKPGRSGTTDEQEMMESGMADIPEVPTPARLNEGSHLDPRSGMISPRAWRTATNESNIRPPQLDPVAVPDSRLFGRSQTESFEMR